ncbi:MAG: hypothetical protein K0M60_11385 [Hydrogenophaga sp.]|nr:hypothetical protein [Hydrogenophaga sp.]
MRVFKAAYFVTVLLVGSVGGLGALSLDVDHQSLLIAVSQFLIAVLTFPLGSVGTVACVALVYGGLTTPEEAIVLAAPLYAVAGGIQWFRLFPAIFHRGPSR